jgi:excisionase family DNA binding protein
MPLRSLCLDPTPLCADGLLRPREAAVFLGTSRSKIYDLMAAGELPYVRIGADRKIPRRACIEYAERRLVQLI